MDKDSLRDMIINKSLGGRKITQEDIKATNEGKKVYTDVNVSNSSPKTFVSENVNFNIGDKIYAQGMSGEILRTFEECDYESYVHVKWSDGKVTQEHKANLSKVEESRLGSPQAGKSRLDGNTSSSIEEDNIGFNSLDLISEQLQMREEEAKSEDRAKAELMEKVEKDIFGDEIMERMQDMLDRLS